MATLFKMLQYVSPLLPTHHRTLRSFIFLCCIEPTSTFQTVTLPLLFTGLEETGELWYPSVQIAATATVYGKEDS